jgi:ligand-binding sensor domain-containing protein
MRNSFVIVAVFITLIQSVIGQTNLMKPLSKNSADNVHCSLQDRKGNLWFATTGDGAFRYDGKNFTNFTTKDGLNSNGIFAIFEDKAGNIWFGTDNGVSRFDGKTFKYIPLAALNGGFMEHLNPKSTTKIGVNRIVEDKNGKFWFATEGGIFCYDGKIVSRFIDNPKLVNPQKFDPKAVINMIEDSKGNMWFCTRAEGIYKFDGKNLFNFKPNGEDWFKGLWEDKAGNIWFGRRYKGLYRFDGKTFTKVLANSFFDECTVSQIMQDRKGIFWFATEAGDHAKRETEGGVWRYDGKVFENVSKKDDLQNDGTWCVLEDKSGNFWVGTRSTGLYRYDGKAFTRFSE